MIETLNRFSDNNVSNAKPDPVPEWDEDESYDGWHKEVKVWSRSKGSSVRKVQLLIEYLKKDNKRGLKELVITEFVENREFDFEANDSIDVILNKVEDHIRESKREKTILLVKEIKTLKQLPKETNKDFIMKFSKLESKIKILD